LPLWATNWALLSNRWSPTGDEALIAWRSWDILHDHGPLVGETTQASSALHTPVFDPGPLLYWVMALPTAISPDRGPAIAVTLFSSICMVAAVVAVRSAVGQRAAYFVVVCALVLQWSLTQQFGTAPTWNCYVPLLPFSALICLAWVVAAGRMGWWPVMVFLGSFATQSHLMYAAPSLALVLLAPMLACLGYRRSGTTRLAARTALISLGSGLAVGLICWAPPLIEEFRNSPGNLTLLWRATVGGTDPTLGLGMGLRRFGQAIYPLDPLWLRPHPSGFRPSELTGHPAIGVIGLICLALVIAFAGRRRTALGALATVVLIADIAGIFTVASISRPMNITIDYIQLIFWPLGIATAGVLIWAAGCVIGWAASRERGTNNAIATGSRQLFSPAGRTTAVSGLVIVAAVLAVWQWAKVPTYATLRAGGDRQRIIQAAGTVVNLVGPRTSKDARLIVDIPPFGGYDGLIAQEAVSYQLRVKGWTPTTDNPIIGALIAPVYTARRSDAHLQFGTSKQPQARLLGSVSFPGMTNPVTVLYVPSSAPAH
jgi:hypothetical protein